MNSLASHFIMLSIRKSCRQGKIATLFRHFAKRITHYHCRFVAKCFFFTPAMMVRHTIFFLFFVFLKVVLVHSGSVSQSIHPHKTHTQRTRIHSRKSQSNGNSSSFVSWFPFYFVCISRLLGPRRLLLLPFEETAASVERNKRGDLLIIRLQS